EAATTAVAYIEDALELLLERASIVESGLLPAQRMARRRFEAAFALARQLVGHQSVSRLALRARRVLSGNDWRVSARLSPASRTNRRFPRTLPRARLSPCPGTCRCTRASRRQWPP